MNYGYPPTDHDELLEAVLSKVLALPIGYSPGSTPYIERDVAYPGVRIRRITDLSEKEQEELILRADCIANTVQVIVSMIHFGPQ